MDNGKIQSQGDVTPETKQSQSLPPGLSLTPSEYMNNREWHRRDFEKIYEKHLDNINHPAHYTQGKIEVIDFIEDQQLNFHEANVIKYVCRHKHKNGVEDLKKAMWYLQRRINDLDQREEGAS
jgi:hypothetical protein